MVRFCLIIVNCAIFHLIPTYALGFFCISPMGSRCNSLHDPRVTGSSPAWLELYTKPKKGSVIPDRLYYDRDSSSFQVNPIIGYHQCKLIGNSNTFEAAYNLVCNLGVPVFDTCFVLPKQSSKLDKVQELCIFASCTRSRIMSLSIRTRSGSTANLAWCCRLVIFVLFLSSLMVRPLSLKI
jgi:hypothetical protein